MIITYEPAHNDPQLPHAQLTGKNIYNNKSAWYVYTIDVCYTAPLVLIVGSQCFQYTLHCSFHTLGIESGCLTTYRNIRVDLNAAHAHGLSKSCQQQYGADGHEVLTVIFSMSTRTLPPRRYTRCVIKADIGYDE